MPILEITDGHGNLLPMAEIELTAASAYPREPEKRFELSEILLCRLVVEGREDLEATDGPKAELEHYVQMLEVLMATSVGPSAVISNGLRRLISAHVAGVLLETHLAARACTDRPIPLEVLVQDLSEYYAGPWFPEPVPSSESMLSKAWARYRSASHLHAMHGWVNYYFDVELINLPAWRYPDFYRCLLSFAEHRRRQAEGLGILNPEETWQAPPDYALLELDLGLADELDPDRFLETVEPLPPRARRDASSQPPCPS